MASIIIDRFTYIEFPDREDIDMNDVTIDANSLSINEVLLSGGISFGNCNSSKFEVSLFGLPDVANERIIVYQIIDGDEENPEPLFTGYVDSCKQDNLSYYRDIIAYDDLYYKGTLNVALWWETYWETRNTTTLGELRTDLLLYMDMTFDEEMVLLNDDYTFKKPCRATTMSFVDMLSQICEVSMVNACMDRDGSIRFISLNPTDKEIKSIVNNYEGANSTFEGFETHLISNIIITDAGDDIICSSGDETTIQSNPYIISKNIFFYDGVAEICKPIADAMYEEVKDITYNPSTVKMILSDLGLKLGDIVRTKKGLSYVFENTLSGALLTEQTIKCDGEEYLNSNRSTYNAEIEALRKKTEDMIKLSSSDLVSTTYTNTDILNIVEEQEIFTLNFTLTKDNPVMFFATINLEMQGDEYTDSWKMIMDKESHTFSQNKIHDTKMEIIYRLNEKEIAYKPHELYINGQHNKTLYYIFETLNANVLYEFKGYMRCSQGMATIGRNQLIATVMAVGLTAYDLPWDGKIDIVEAIEPFTIKQNIFNLEDIDESNDVESYLRDESNVTQNVGIFTVKHNKPTLDAINEQIVMSVLIKQAVIDAKDVYEFTFDTEQVYNNLERFSLNTDYTYTSSEYTEPDVKLGKTLEVDIPLDKFSSVRGVDVIKHEY